ncbi:MAG: flagellin [Cognaticolwellia sp.]
MIFGALDTRLQHGLGRTMRSLNKGIRKVGSGLRVSRAADDAAGLAVAEGLDAVVRSKRMAARNIQDGLSALDVADSGLGIITSNLHRLRELAVQGAGETLSDSARLGLQLEAEGIVSQVTRTAMSAEWGGKPLLAERAIDVGLLIDLSGSMGGELAQVKTQIASFKQAFRTAGMNVSLGLGVMGQDRLDGVTKLVDLGDASFNRRLDELATIGGTAMDPWSALLNSSGAQPEVGEDGNDAFGWHKIAASKVLIVLTDTGRETSYVSTSQSDVAAQLSAIDVEVHAITRSASASAFSTITGGTGGATHNIGSNGALIGAALSSIAASLAVLPAEEPMSVQVSHGSSDAHRIDLATPANVTSLALGIDDVDMSTALGAQEAIEAVDEALKTVNSARSKVGASENRLWSALRSSEGQTEALQAAKSRIQDADLAQETAQLARDQIIAQAALSVAIQLRRAERETMQALLA